MEHFNKTCSFWWECLILNLIFYSASLFSFLPPPLHATHLSSSSMWHLEYAAESAIVTIVTSLKTMSIGRIFGRKKEKKATHHCSLSTLSSEPIKRKKGQHPEVTWIASCIPYLPCCVTKSPFSSPWVNTISLTLGSGRCQRTGVPQRSASRELLLFNILPHFLLNCLGFRCSCKWGLSSCQFK